MKRLLIAAILFAAPAGAAQPSAEVARDVAPAATSTSKPPEKIDYFGSSLHEMHEAMGAATTGNIDVDFANGMIAHHQGAIEMAKIHLKYSKDPELRALSEKIIAAQGPEIRQMQDWLAKHHPK